MKQSHKCALEVLQEKGFVYGWKVTGSATSISLYKPFGKRVISADLIKENGGYRLIPFKYPYKNRSCYFNYTSEEERWTRDKSFLISLTNLLKRCDVWDLIIDKENFIVVNKECAHLNGQESKVKKILKEILSENMVIRKRQTVKPKAHVNVDKI